MLQKNKSICVRVYIIYICIYIYTHTIYVFLLNVFLWDFNQNKDKQAFHINAFDHLQIFMNTKSHSTCSLIGKKDVCGECVWVWVCVHTRLLQSASHVLWRRYSFTKIFLIQICFLLVFSLLTARNTDGSSSASLISSWIFFFSSNNCLKQLLEYCP